MVGAERWEDYAERVGFTPKGRTYFQGMRNSDPSRRVQSRSNNANILFASRKRGESIQCESHTVELPFVFLTEHDPITLDFYDQPPAVKLSYEVEGRSRSHFATPDFFLIRKEEAGFVECKPHDKLVELAAKRPWMFHQDENGQWHCPPGERAAAELGFFFRVWTPNETNPVLIRNLKFLHDYLDADYPDLPDETRHRLKHFLASSEGISLLEATQQSPEFSFENLYVAIAKGHTFIDMETVSFTHPEKIRLFSNEASERAFRLASNPNVRSDQGVGISSALATGSEIAWKGEHFTVALLQDSNVTLVKNGKTVVLDLDTFNQQCKNGEIRAGEATKASESSEFVHEIMSRANRLELEEANRRYEILQNPESKAATVTPERTRRRWERRFEDAERLHGCGYIGLIPGYQKRGNRTQKYSADVVNLAESIIEQNYCNLKRSNKHQVYLRFRHECEQQGYEIPSNAWFAALINSRDKHATILSREGKRSAYQVEPIKSLRLEDIHGDYPFQVVYVDHTKIDLELICSKTGIGLGRAYLTLLVDGYSRRIAAFTLTFDPPSARTCQMLIRECVRRHNRLPSCVVVDGGGEFHSTYFETLMARYGCSIRKRPPAQSRAGTLVERCFGVLNTQFFYNLAGNTQVMKNVRTVTKSVNPKRHAVWPLERLDALLNEFCYSLYDERLHSTLGMSPRECWERGMEVAGDRLTRIVPYDDEFVMLTMPTTPRGVAKVQREGAKINYLYYSCQELRDTRVLGKKVPVRFDPFNLAEAYVYIGGRWVKCLSQHFDVFENRTFRELKLASEEMRQLKKQIADARVITAGALVDFFVAAENEEKLLRQRLKDLAQRNIQQQRVIGEPSETVNTDFSNCDESERETEIDSSNSTNGHFAPKDSDMEDFPELSTI